jgi:hypothetical protein
MGQGDPGGQHQAGMTRTRWHAAPLGGKLAKGVGILKVARSLGIGTGTVQRIASGRAMSPRGAEQ